MKKTHLNSIVISVFILPACTLAQVQPSNPAVSGPAPARPCAETSLG
jgi:hypothetical protein